MKLRLRRLNQSGFDHVMILVVFVVLFALIGTALLIEGHAATPSPTPQLQTTLGSNICIAGGVAVGAVAHLGTCDGSASEQWKAAGGVIKNTAASGGPYCLQAASLPKTGNPTIGVVGAKCSSSASQKWSGAGNPTELKNGAVSSATDPSLKNGDCLVYPNNDAAVNLNNSLAIEMVGCSTARPADQVWNTSTTHTVSSGGGGGSEGNQATAICKSLGVNGAECSNVGLAVNIVAADHPEWNNPTQLACMGSLWYRESTWRTTAANASGAYGIPQALPGSKMASAGPNWQTNPTTQIKWGLGYIKGQYSYDGEKVALCTAWHHDSGIGWYVVTNVNGETVHS